MQHRNCHCLIWHKRKKGFYYNVEQIHYGEETLYTATPNTGGVFLRGDFDNAVKHDAVWALYLGLVSFGQVITCSGVKVPKVGPSAPVELMSDENNHLNHAGVKGGKRKKEAWRFEEYLRILGACVNGAEGLWCVVKESTVPTEDRRIDVKIAPVVGMTATIYRQKKGPAAGLHATVEVVGRGKDGNLGRVVRRHPLIDIYSV